MHMDLLRDSKRLSNLSKVLNLEFAPNRCESLLVEEYRRTKEYVELQDRICCSYGIDCCVLSSPAAILKQMADLLSQFSNHESVALAFCHLKVELCYEQDRFLEEIVFRIEQRLKCSCDPEEERRLISAFFKIRNVYPNI